MPPPHLNTQPEVCEKLRISRGTYFNLIKSNALESIRIGSRRFVTDRQIAEYIERLEQGVA